MQINEITQIPMNEQLGSLVGDLVRAFASKDTDKQDLEADVRRLAKEALPQWLGKRAQLERTLDPAQLDLDEELEAWIEDNIFRSYLKLDSVDPRYQTVIKRQINLVNSVADVKQRQQAFEKLIAAAMMARPTRSQAAQITGTIPTRIDPSGDITIGKHKLDPNDKNEAVLIALINNMRAQGKI